MTKISKSFYKHPHAIIDNGAIIGANTRIWAFTHITAGAIIGEECNLCDHTFVEGGVSLGNRVTVKCGVYLWNGITAEDDVFIGPCVAFTNDLRPRSKLYPNSYLKTIIRQGSSIGANATILPVIIGRYAMVGAGSVVTRNVPDFALVYGNPAKVQGSVCRCGNKLAMSEKKRIVCSCGKKYLKNSKHFLEELPNEN